MVGLCEMQERPLRKEIKVEENVQDKFDHFVNVFYQEFTLKIEEVGAGGQQGQGLLSNIGQGFQAQQQNQQQIQQGPQTSKTAINFSFEKKLKMAAAAGGNKKFDGLQGYIKE